MKVQNYNISILDKIKDYQSLIKLRLALSVVFSACTAFVLGSSDLSISGLFLIGLGGLLVTASSNALNQVLEKDTDKLMNRTKNRPLAAGKMEVSEAVLIAGLTGTIGIIILSLFNPLSAVLGALSLVSYAFIYTPMKKVSPAAVWIGAIPGALPMAIGWIAASNDGSFSNQAIFLFSLQFLWQFPHFWAIAWVAYEDYAKAGFYLLPSNQRDGRNKSTALQIIFYVVCLILLSYVPFYVFDISGFYACTIMMISGLVFLYYALKLYFNCDNSSARKLMFASLFYQVVVFISLMINKI